MTPRRRFRFLRELAQGGFGKVYLAEMITTDNFSSVVAIKLLHGQWTTHEEIAQRARDEARLLGRLRHPNIVRVEDLTSIRGQAAVIMEYLEGLDLKSLTNFLVNQGQRLPLGAVFEIVAAVASALEAAYSHVPLQGGEPLRLIHRDIKPSNVMVTVNGDVKLLDFGTARANFEDREAKTQALAFGSQAYMAPERLLGDPDTPAGDVFSLGVTTYEIMSGGAFGKIHIRPERYEKSMVQRVDELDLASLGPDMAEQVRKLLRAMLAYEPSERPNAGQVVDAMEALAEACTEMGLRRFARLMVRESMEANPHEVSGDDDLAGSTLFEDRSATFDTEGLDNSTMPPPEPERSTPPPRPTPRPEPRADPVPVRPPLGPSLEPVPIPPPPVLQPARTHYPDLPDEVSEETLPERSTPAALGPDIGHLVRPPADFDEDLPTVLAPNPLAPPPVAQAEAPRQEPAPALEPLFGRADSTVGLAFPVELDEPSAEVPLPEVWPPQEAPPLEPPPAAQDDATPAVEAPTDTLAAPPVGPPEPSWTAPAEDPSARTTPPPDDDEDLGAWPHVASAQQAADAAQRPGEPELAVAAPPELSPSGAEPAAAELPARGAPGPDPALSVPPVPARAPAVPDASPRPPPDAPLRPPVEPRVRLEPTLDLRPTAPEPDVDPEPPPTRSRAPLFAALGLVALLGLAGVGWALSQGDPDPVQTTEVQDPPPIDPQPPEQPDPGEDGAAVAGDLPPTDAPTDAPPDPVRPDPPKDPTPKDPAPKDPAPKDPTVKDPTGQVRTDPRPPDPPKDPPPAASAGGLVLTIVPFGSGELTLSNASGYSKSWDGGGGRLKVDGVASGTYRTKVTPKDGGAPRRSTVKVEPGKTCSYSLDIANNSADWELSKCE